MTTIKLCNKEYQIKYGFEVTVKSGIIKRLASLSTDEGGADVDATLRLLPELLLIGLQKNHADEFGYNYDDAESKEKALSKVYSLLDDYFDGEDADFGTMLSDLQEELTNNGFLSKLFRKEVEAEQEYQNKKKNR